MNDSRALCWFGKLPCIGDFCSFNMSAALLTALDDWLSSVMQTGACVHGPAWMQAYFQTPIHGFVWSENTLPLPGKAAMLGVIMPSVDKAGRAFPFVLMEQLSSNALPQLSMSAASRWFIHAHALCADALNEEWTLDQLGCAIHKLPTLDELIKQGSTHPVRTAIAHSEWFRIDFDGRIHWVMRCRGLPTASEFERLLGIGEATL